MNTKARHALILILVLLAGAAVVAMTWAAPQASPQAAPQAGGSPAVVAYQGEVQIAGVPYTGAGHFKFAVVNADGDASYWSNDGSSLNGGLPALEVELDVSDGLFSVLLGDTDLDGMTQALAANVFSQPDRYLRVWFSTSVGGPFYPLVPDTRIAAVPYALQAQEAVDADTVDGLHANQLGINYQNVVVVAHSGADYTSVQAAINDITDAAADNPYLVWVAPGVYSETVTMKPHVHLQGAGQGATIITSTSTASSGDWPPAQPTLMLARDVSLRDLTVVNSGAGDSNTALLATAGMTRTLAADVTVRAVGGGTDNFAIFLSGGGTGVTLQRVAALSENGTNLNLGLVNFDGAAATLLGGSFTAREGESAYGILSLGSGTTTLEADGVTALAEKSNNKNFGLYNIGGSVATVHGGSFTGRGGNQTRGIENANNGSILTAEGVTALAEDGNDDNYGLGSYDGVTTTVRGGSFAASGGANAHGISNGANNARLEADSVTAMAQGGTTYNYGLFSFSGASTALRGGSFTASGGDHAYGIYNIDSDTSLEADSVTALGENGHTTSYGLLVFDSAAATLHGGAFTGRGGGDAFGIMIVGSGATLNADAVTALAENSDDANFGLYIYGGGVATLRGGSFTGRGGVETRGIENANNGSTLTAVEVTTLAEEGSSENYGLGSYDGVTTTLRGGSFIGRGGAVAYGVANGANGATLDAENITALAEDGGDYNYGLHNFSGGSTTVRGGSFAGRGGAFAYGIYNADETTMLEAAGLTAVGEDSATGSYGLYSTASITTSVTLSVLEGASYSVYRGDGPITISNSRLVGGSVSGTVTCVLVTRGTDISYDGATCP